MHSPVAMRYHLAAGAPNFFADRMLSPREAPPRRGEAPQEENVEHLHSESAKWRHDDAADDAPAQESMRQATKPVQRRNPSTDQKRVRREMNRKTADVQVQHAPGAQTHTRTVAEDDDFDSYLITRCGDHGTKIVSDRPSQEQYINFAHGCHDEAAHPDPRRQAAHRRDVHFDGTDCWSCCPEMYVAKPGERESGRIAMRMASIDRAGDRECQACGHTGSPVLADTGPACRQCGSYSLKRSQHKAPETDARSRSDYGRTANIDRAGDRECQACGHTGSPVLADTGPACRQCGSYSLKRSPHKAPAQATVPAPAEYGRTAGQKTATQFQTNVATSDGRLLLNPGDQIRMPTGQTMKVNQVRRHETSKDHYYVDTDAGTTVVPWSTSFEVVPSNQRQQELPGFGTPGGNSNALPFDPENAGSSNQMSAPNKCPVCGASGSLARRGDKYQCSRCGYSENYMGGGNSGMSFSDATQTIMSSRDHRSVIARRAADVLDQTKETAL